MWGGWFKSFWSLVYPCQHKNLKIVHRYLSCKRRLLSSNSSRINHDTSSPQIKCIFVRFNFELPVYSHAKDWLKRKREWVFFWFNFKTIELKEFDHDFGFHDEENCNAVMFIFFNGTKLPVTIWRRFRVAHPCSHMGSEKTKAFFLKTLY